MITNGKPVGAVLVVGGGISGIQTALDLAESGFYVYLAESSSAIGGRMAQLDKTFPTNDCAMCMLSPKLVEVGRHHNVQVLPDMELIDLEGEPGRFMARLRCKPRYVDIETCIGCDECTKVCPVSLPSEFDEGLGTRKAIYRLYPQAIPNVFTISRLGAPACEAACPIHQNAHGYVSLIAEGKYHEALDVILRDNPLPSICGRVCVHPCEDACVRAEVDEPISIAALKRFVVDQVGDYQLPRPDPDQERTERIAIVGAGPAGLTCAYDLRQRGYQTTIYESLPVAGGMLAVGIPEHRLPEQILKQEIARIEATGVEI
ncbi:MAG: NAD(P)-binding protein, partial [Candidatus Bipolaricaulia bacterium]